METKRAREDQARERRKTAEGDGTEVNREKTSSYLGRKRTRRLKIRYRRD